MTKATKDKAELLPELGVLPGHLFWRASTKVSAALDATLPRGVDVHGCAALMALPDGVTRSQQEVADTIGVSRTTMATVAAGLAVQGLLVRNRNPDDRRSWGLTRTAAGGEALERWTWHLEEAEAVLTASLTGDDCEALGDLLTMLVGPHLAPDVPGPLAGSLGYLITREHAHLHRLFAEALTPTGVEPRQFGTLVALRTLGPTPQIGLARTLGVSGARMVWIADELEDKGYVERRRDPADRRTQVIHLLPRGQKVLVAAERAADSVDREALSALTPAQTQRLCALLRRFITG